MTNNVNESDPDRDLEELEELGDESEILDSKEEKPAAEPAIIEKYYSASSNPFVNSIFPVLFLDRNMKILYANKACKNLFTGFFDLAGNYFMDVFGKAFEIEDIRKIRETIINGQNGYTWKGRARIKARHMATVQTRVYLFAAELNLKEQNEFIIMFDDVTEEDKRLLRSVFMSLLEASILKDNDTGKHIARVN
ncbi:MAG: PAS domain-containing protein, partial [Treponema sp.]|nr:PAS domain-containing protein [Treponema sp.]